MTEVDLRSASYLFGMLCSVLIGWGVGHEYSTAAGCAVWGALNVLVDIRYMLGEKK